VGFVIPKRRLDEIVGVLKTGRSLYRGWLGISVDRTVPGVVIQNVANPSPTRGAGVLPGDKILAVNDRPIKNFNHLVKTLYMIPAGETVDLHIDREQEELTVTVKLARDIELGPLPEIEDPPDPWSSPSPPGDEGE
jgi:S1-C subfamily serine protease